jgi:hypothetical protein
MNCILQKRRWLAGASLLAILLGSADANADLFGLPGIAEYIIPSTGHYDFTVAGADGGGGDLGVPGGAGAVVGGELFFHAGAILDIIVGGAGVGGYRPTSYGGGGGGGSFVFSGGSYLSGGLLFAAGGGGGAPAFLSPGRPGYGYGGHPVGPASYGGAGGGGVAIGIPGHPAYGQTPAQAGSFPSGGAGACCYFGGGPAGGFGGGGGGGYDGGGGGGGAPGGGSGEGGSSYVIDTARNPFGITGGNLNGYRANGYVSIDFVGSSVPEPSTWAMTLAGFTGLGWLARLRRRKLTPA